MAKTKNRKKTTGRPRSITKPTLRKLEEVFAYGGTDEEAAFYAGIGTSTLYDYCKKNPEFSERKAALKLKPILKARRTVFENLDDLSTARWFLERRVRSEFGRDADEQVTSCDCPKTLVEWMHGLKEVKKNGRKHYIEREEAHAV